MLTNIGKPGRGSGSGAFDVPSGGKIGASRNRLDTLPGFLTAYGPIVNAAADQPMKATFFTLRSRMIHSTTVFSSSRSLFELVSWNG